jgi:hypothetical protein
MFQLLDQHTTQHDQGIMNDKGLAEMLLDRLAPKADEPDSERIWRFSERMATLYLQQMQRFDQDASARQWRRLYSADNLPPPSEMRTRADLAAMLAFYSPTNFCKFQKAITQQLLEWHFRQRQVSPYPFGSRSFTLIDIGAGVGIASLAIIDLLATWAEIVAELGYGQPGLSVRVIAVEPDSIKQDTRQDMFAGMSSLLDRSTVKIEGLSEILLPFPEPECMQQVFSAAAGGPYAICCMSNFLSSLPTEDQEQPAQVMMRADSQSIDDLDDEEALQWSRSPIRAEELLQCADTSRHLVDELPFENRLLLAAELNQRGPAVRLFAGSVYPSLELSVRRNRVRFYAPQGSYWYSAQNGEHPSDPDWVTPFWSLAYCATRNAGSA